MSQSMTQVTRQEHTQHLSIEMRCGVELMQMNITELREHLLNAMLSNPFLAEAQPDLRRHKLDQPQPRQIGLDSLVEQGRNPYRDWRDYERSAHNRKDLDNAPGQEETLEEYLMANLGYMLNSKRDERIAAYLIGSIDSNG